MGFQQIWAAALLALPWTCPQAFRLVAEESLDAKALDSDEGATFLVKQYNILAGYLGNNMEPWFLYGLDANESRRAAIMAAHYTKGPDGKYPYTRENRWGGLISEAEAGILRQVHDRFFDWQARRERLLREMLRDSPEILILEELDHVDDFFGPELLNHGYFGVFQKRPRMSSLDGVGIYWRANRFELIAKDHTVFKDPTMVDLGLQLKDFSTYSLDPNAAYTEDRMLLLVALRDKFVNRKLLVAGTHLMRNPDDRHKEILRRVEVTQVHDFLQDFVQKHRIKLSGVVKPTQGYMRLVSRFRNLVRRHQNPKRRGPVYRNKRSQRITALARGLRAMRAARLERAKCECFPSPDAVVLAGDLNSMRDPQRRLKLGVQLDECQPGIDDQVHMLFGGNAGSAFPREPPLQGDDSCTTKTQQREMWIDYIFYTCRSLQLTMSFKDACPASFMPDAVHPSDHVPIGALFRWRPIGHALDDFSSDTWCDDASRNISPFRDATPE